MFKSSGKTKKVYIEDYHNGRYEGDMSGFFKKRNGQGTYYFKSGIIFTG